MVLQIIIIIIIIRRCLFSKWHRVRRGRLVRLVPDVLHTADGQRTSGKRATRQVLTQVREPRQQQHRDEPRHRSRSRSVHHGRPVRRLTRQSPHVTGSGGHRVTSRSTRVGPRMSLPWQHEVAWKKISTQVIRTPADRTIVPCMNSIYRVLLSTVQRHRIAHVVYI